ncbi:MAG: hypothetical protein O2888_02375 [Chloroflexi bacterium]|nr:hypothetical protein [Chloroflexota bacterium]
MTTDTSDATAPEHPTSIDATFQDMYVLAAGDVDTFAINWNEHDEPPPFYVNVDGKKFAYSGLTFLVRGYGAELPTFVREEEQAGHLVLFVERGERLLSYVFDPEAEDDEDAGE